MTRTVTVTLNYDEAESLLAGWEPHQQQALKDARIKLKAALDVAPLYVPREVRRGAGRTADFLASAEAIR